MKTLIYLFLVIALNTHAQYYSDGIGWEMDKVRDSISQTAVTHVMENDLYVVDTVYGWNAKYLFTNDTCTSIMYMVAQSMYADYLEHFREHLSIVDDLTFIARQGSWVFYYFVFEPKDGFFKLNIYGFGN
jgi:hypothetical protein